MSELDNIKVGDSVTLIRGNSISGIKKVIRITKTLIITEGWNDSVKEIRWSKANSHEIGSKGIWNAIYIEPTTEEHRQIIHQNYLLNRVIKLTENLKLEKPSTDKLYKLLKVLRDER